MKYFYYWIDWNWYLHLCCFYQNILVSVFSSLLNIIKNSDTENNHDYMIFYQYTHVFLALHGNVEVGSFINWLKYCPWSQDRFGEVAGTLIGCMMLNTFRNL